MGYRLSFLLVTVFLACSVPIYDRAEVKPGPILNGGVGIGTGITPSGVSGDIGLPFGWSHFDYHTSLLITAGLGYGFNNRVAVVFQGAYGTGWWLTGPAGGEPEVPRVYQFSLGIKFRTTPNSALQANLGLPCPLELVYLRNFNPHFTGNASLGFNGVGIGLTGVYAINPRLALFLAGRAVSGWEWLLKPDGAIIPAVSLGVGLGFTPKR